MINIVCGIVTPTSGEVLIDGRDWRSNYRFARERIPKDMKQEVFAVILLDAKHQLLPDGYRVISVGSLTGALVHPREVFRPAVREAAAALLLVHNHPSNDPTPSPEDVDITITGQTLSIRGEFKADEEISRDQYLYRERRYGTFNRQLQLPVRVKGDAAEATFENGLLTLHVPKAEEVKPRQIEVKAGQDTKVAFELKK